MRTENLTYIEAVKALKERRCEGITRALWECSLVWLMGIDSLILCENKHIGDPEEGETFYPGVCNTLATDWQLVNPIVPTRKEEVKRWAKIFDGKWCGAFADEEDAENWKSLHGYRAEIVELIGYREVPIAEPEPTEWSDVVVTRSSPLGLVACVNVPYEWLNKTVTIRLKED